MQARDKALQKIKELHDIRIALSERKKKVLDSVGAPSEDDSSISIDKFNKDDYKSESLEQLNSTILLSKEKIPKQIENLNLYLLKKLRQPQHSEALRKILWLVPHISQDECNNYFEKLLSLKTDAIENFVKELPSLPQNKSDEYNLQIITTNITLLYRQAYFTVKEIACYQTTTAHDADLNELNLLDDKATASRDTTIFDNFLRKQIEKRISILKMLEKFRSLYSPESPKITVEQKEEGILINQLTNLNAQIKEARRKVDHLSILRPWKADAANILSRLDNGLTHFAKFQEFPQDSHGNTSEFLIFLDNIKEEFYQQKTQSTLLLLSSYNRHLHLSDSDAISTYSTLEELMKQAKETGDYKSVDQYLEYLKNRVDIALTQKIIAAQQSFATLTNGLPAPFVACHFNDFAKILDKANKTGIFDPVDTFLKTLPKTIQKQTAIEDQETADLVDELLAPSSIAPHAAKFSPPTPIGPKNVKEEMRFLQHSIN